MKIEIETKFDIGDKVTVKNSGLFHGKNFIVDNIEISKTLGIPGNPIIRVWVTNGVQSYWFYEDSLEKYTPKKHYVITCHNDGSAPKTTWHSSMQEAIKAVQEHQERTMLDKSITYIIGYTPDKE